MTQPKALFLADVLHNDPASKSHHDEAAFELRRLHAENASLRQIVEDFPPVEAELREVSDRAHRLKTQRDALLEALKEYGWHHEGCPQYPTYTHPDRWPACTCGFDDAIKAVEEEQK